MKKALIYGLSLALLLVNLTACHKPQADQPTEPDPPQAATSTQADLSTPEPLADPGPEPPEQAPAPPEQLSDTIPAAPDEVEDTEPPEETDPEKTAPAEQAEQPPEATPPTTEPVVQQPSGGGQQQTQQTPQGGSISLKDAAEQQGVQVTEQNTGKIWDQTFYDSLNPQQQAAYKNADDSTRIQMKDIIEVNRQLDQQGYEGDGDLTQEQVRETWSNIIVN